LRVEEAQFPNDELNISNLHYNIALDNPAMKCNATLQKK